MKSTLNIIAVGAGGVASYLFPALSKTFNLSGYLIDGDKLEKHNLDRQMFNPQDVGKFKAESLIKHQKLTGIRPRCFYLDESKEVFSKGRWFLSFLEEFDITEQGSTFAATIRVSFVVDTF